MNQNLPKGGMILGRKVRNKTTPLLTVKICTKHHAHGMPNKQAKGYNLKS